MPLDQVVEVWTAGWTASWLDVGAAVCALATQAVGMAVILRWSWRRVRGP